MGNIFKAPQRTRALRLETGKIELGKKITVYFSEEIAATVKQILNRQDCETVRTFQIAGQSYDLIFSPLSGRFFGQGVILTLIRHG